MLLDDVLDDRHLHLGLSLLVQVREPALEDVGRIEEHVDLVAAVLDHDRRKLRAALRRPLGRELLGDFRHDGGGSLVVRVGGDAAEILRVVEAVVDPLGEDLDAGGRWHDGAEFLIEVTGVQRHGGFSLDGCEAGGRRQGLGGEDVVLRAGVQLERDGVTVGRCNVTRRRGGLRFGGEGVHGLLELGLLDIEVRDRLILRLGRIDHRLENGSPVLVDGGRLESVKEVLAVDVLNLGSFFLGEFVLPVLDGQLLLPEHGGDDTGDAFVLELGHGWLC